MMIPHVIRGFFGCVRGRHTWMYLGHSPRNKGQLRICRWCGTPQILMRVDAGGTEHWEDFDD